MCALLCYNITAKCENVCFILLCGLCYYCAPISYKEINEKASEFLMEKFILLLINVLVPKVASEYIKRPLLCLDGCHFLKTFFFSI